MISYGQYNELMTISGTGIIDNMVSVICIVKDLTDVDVLEWSVKKIKEEFNIIKNIVQSIGSSPVFQEVVECPFGTAHYKSISTMTLGEYIDLEHFMKNQEYGKLLALVYRRKNNSKWDKDEWEDWGGYSEKRKEAFNDLDANVCISAINKTVIDKQEFIKHWDFIFEKNEFDYDEELNRDDITTEEKNIILDERKKDELRSSLNFEILIHNITGGDKLKIDETLKLNIGLIFKFIAVDKHLRENKIV